MNEKKLLMFDLDGTLAKSKSPIEKNMVDCLMSFLPKMYLAVISGCSWRQMEEQFLKNFIKFSGANTFLSNLFLMPTCGSQLYIYEKNRNEFYKKYHNDLTNKERGRIFSAFNKAREKSKIDLSNPYGPILEDKGSQITFSLRGQQAPLSIKEVWDPDFSKRKQLVELMKPELSGLEVGMGGTTSIDVTKKGIDKAYGLYKLLGQIKNVSKEEVLFVGDALFEGGNDFPIKQEGVESYWTTGPENTIDILSRLYNLTS